MLKSENLKIFSSVHKINIIVRYPVCRQHNKIVIAHTIIILVNFYASSRACVALISNDMYN